MTPLMRVNLVLLALVLILGTLALESMDESADAISHLTPDNIHLIKIKNINNDSNLIFHKQDNRWQLSHDKKLLLNDEVINRLLGMVNTHSHRQFENTEENRKQFQLDKPGFQLTFNQQTILFGTTEPVNHHRYVLLDNRIHLIKDLYLPFLMADAAFFVQPEHSEKTHQPDTTAAEQKVN